MWSCECISLPVSIFPPGLGLGWKGRITRRSWDSVGSIRYGYDLRRGCCRSSLAIGISTNYRRISHVNINGGKTRTTCVFIGQNCGTNACWEGRRRATVTQCKCWDNICTWSIARVCSCSGSCTYIDSLQKKACILPFVNVPVRFRKPGGVFLLASVLQPSERLDCQCFYFFAEHCTCQNQ